MTLTDLIAELIEIREKFGTDPNVTDVEISYDFLSRKVTISDGASSEINRLEEEVDNLEDKIEKLSDKIEEQRQIASLVIAAADELEKVDDDYVQEIRSDIKELLK